MKAKIEQLLNMLKNREVNEDEITRKQEEERTLSSQSELYALFDTLSFM